MGTSAKQAWSVSHAQGEDAWSTSKILYLEYVQDINSFCISYALPCCQKKFPEVTNLVSLIVKVYSPANHEFYSIHSTMQSWKMY